MAVYVFHSLCTTQFPMRSWTYLVFSSFHSVDDSKCVQYSWPRNEFDCNWYLSRSINHRSQLQAKCCGNIWWNNIIHSNHWRYAKRWLVEGSILHEITLFKKIFKLNNNNYFLLDFYFVCRFDGYKRKPSKRTSAKLLFSM